MSLFHRTPKRALILGCGPAGLFAAHAFATRGWDIEIWSRKRRSEMFGAQYLHAPIPYLTEGTQRELTYKLVGTVEDYRRKVYGNVPVEFVSPERIPERQTVWDIRQAYYTAWDFYSGYVKDMEVTPTDVVAAIGSKDYCYILSSIAAPVLCTLPAVHQWKARQIYAIGDAPERGVECPVPCPPFTVICNGEPYQSWYRVSNIYGYRTAEWSTDRKPPYGNPALVTKPISTTCNTCLPEVVRIGRYGRWDKSELSHQAYERAKELINS